MKMKFIYLSIIVFMLLSISSGLISNKIVVNNSNKLAKNDLLEQYGYVKGYTCKKITVLDKDGNYQGKYDLEDYVGRVVSGETHILDDQVTFEAMSVVIRTYALYVTHNCKNPIKNSEAHQVMANTVSKKIRNAVSKTKGQVLVLDNKLVLSEYDSFFMGNGFYCDRKFCYSTYLKVGSNKTKNPKAHKIKVPASWAGDLSGGHGKGLSQYGAKYLASQGYNYEQILEYFYADGSKLGTIIKPNIDGLKMENGFITRETRPLRTNQNFYVKGEVPNNTLEGESTWYATSRANEILRNSNNKKRIGYFDSPSKYCNLTNFNKSDDYTKPKRGAIISWNDHVAIIENVTEDTVDISEAYPGLGYYGSEYAFEHLNKNGKYYNVNTNKIERKTNCEKDGSGCFKRTNSIKISDLNKRWGYEFKCYVYLID